MSAKQDVIDSLTPEEKAAWNCKQAIEFFDKVKKGTPEEQVAVGTDHYEWLEDACRHAAKFCPDLDKRQAEMREKMRVEAEVDRIVDSFDFDNCDYSDLKAMCVEANLPSLAIADAVCKVIDKHRDN